ncbi:MAG: flagellar export chaperone FliS [Clostridium sp. SCN 57-10]|nr:MAG: flagellar export chaperone FliS [Clostridium sp. SCN 57-10]
MTNNPYQAYKQQSFMTMTSGDLLIALFDGLLKELNRALLAFQQKNLEEVNHGLQKAQAMLRHLNSTLDDRYPISANLHSLYDYFLNVTLQANLKKDPHGVEEIIPMITELRDAYYQADKLSRTAAAQ